MMKGRQGGAGINHSSSGAGGVEKCLEGPYAFGDGTRVGCLLGTDVRTELWGGLGSFKTGRIWGSFVAAGSLLFPHTFNPDQLSWLSSPLSHVVGASYHLCSHPFFHNFPFALHWPLQTLLRLPGFGKRAGVLAVGKVIKEGMKSNKGTVQRWRQDFSDLEEQGLLLLQSCMTWERCMAEGYAAASCTHLCS